MKTIPSKDRKEWRLLLTGDLNVSLKNFFFQMKVTQAKNQVMSGKIDIDEAVDEIYQLCHKFRKAKFMDEDLNKIFGDDITESSQEEPVAVSNIDAKIQEQEEKDVEAEDPKLKEKERIIQQIKRQEIEARNLRIKAEKEELERIKKELEQEREKAKMLIEKQLEEERKNKLKSIEEKRKKAELERQKVQKITRHKKVTKQKKKSFWGFIFGK